MHLTDEDVRQRILDQLNWDTRVSDCDIEVTLIDGRVRLSGSAPSHYARHAVESNARLAAGVKGIENLITIIEPDEQHCPADLDLQSRVIKVLVWDANIDPADIRVRVVNSVAVIEGTVASLSQKQRAEELASNISGVSKVENLLSVAPTGRYVDKLIAEDIMRALERDPRVEAKTIDITVKDGEVQLRGSVPDQDAYKAAEDAARLTDGVIEVENHLLVI